MLENKKYLFYSKIEVFRPYLKQSRATHKKNWNLTFARLQLMVLGRRPYAS